MEKNDLGLPHDGGASESEQGGSVEQNEVSLSARESKLLKKVESQFACDSAKARPECNLIDLLKKGSAPSETKLDEKRFVNIGFQPEQSLIGPKQLVVLSYRWTTNFHQKVSYPNRICAIYGRPTEPGDAELAREAIDDLSRGNTPTENEGYKWAMKYRWRNRDCKDLKWSDKRTMLVSKDKQWFLSQYKGRLVFVAIDWFASPLVWMHNVDGGFSDKSRNVGVEKKLPELIVWGRLRTPIVQDIVIKLIKLREELEPGTFSQLNLAALGVIKKNEDVCIGDKEDLEISNSTLCARQVSWKENKLDDSRWVEYLTCCYGAGKIVQGSSCKSCIGKAGISTAKVTQCIKDYAKKDIKMFATLLDAMGSSISGFAPIMFFGQKEYMGGRNGQDYLRFICSELGEEGSKAPSCKNTLPLPKVEAVWVYDSSSDYWSFAHNEKILKMLIPGLTLNKMRATAKPVQSLVEKVQKRHPEIKIPFIMFDDALPKHPSAMKCLEDGLHSIGRAHIWGGGEIRGKEMACVEGL